MLRERVKHISLLSYHVPKSTSNVNDASVESEITGNPFSDIVTRDIVTSESKKQDKHSSIFL